MRRRGKGLKVRIAAIAFTLAAMLGLTLAGGAMLGSTAYSADMDEASFLSAATAALEARLSENYRTEGFLPVLEDGTDVSNLENAGIHRYIYLRTADTDTQ